MHFERHIAFQLHKIIFFPANLGKTNVTVTIIDVARGFRRGFKGRTIAANRSNDTDVKVSTLAVNARTKHKENI